LIVVVGTGSLAGAGAKNCEIGGRTCQDAAFGSVISEVGRVDGTVQDAGLSGWVFEVIVASSPGAGSVAIFCICVAISGLALRTLSDTLARKVISEDVRSSAAGLDYAEPGNRVAIFGGN
jgi:hypothetical protein